MARLRLASCRFGWLVSILAGVAFGSPQGAWLSISLTESTLELSCLRHGCREPQFRLAMQVSDATTEQSLRWPADGAVSSLPQAHTIRLRRQAANLTVYAEVVGTDPLYNFPRVCDSSPNVASIVSSFDRQTIDFHGACFNLSADAVRHCCGPACVSSAAFVRCPTPTADARRTLGGTNPLSSTRRLGGGSVVAGVPLLWTTAAMAVVALLLLVACALVTVAYLGERRKTAARSGSSSKRPPRSRCVAESGRKPVRSESVESRYDAPWEHKFRPLPEWLRAVDDSPGDGERPHWMRGGRSATITDVTLPPPSLSTVVNE